MHLTTPCALTLVLLDPNPFDPVYSIGTTVLGQTDWALAAICGAAVLLLSLLWLFRHFRSAHGSPEVSRSKLQIETPIEGGELGNEVLIQAHLQSARKLHLDYLLVRLVNKRLEKKAPLDKVVGHSTFLFRHNIDREITSGEITEEPILIRIPSCREATRESKYVSITWEVSPEAHFSSSSGSRRTRYVYRGTPSSIQIRPPSIA